MAFNFPKIEEKILKFWKKNKIFEKSLKKTKKGPRFIFYEGPPFANGLPGIHHLLARAFKDVILRYRTMRGFFVERKAGWDTHGLPTEIGAEKKLGIKTKKEIEKLGIGKFIAECKRNVFTYKKEWEEFTDRIGFWLDLKRAYITCSNDYIETLWWILKKIWEKGLLYRDYKVVPYCPRCGTSLSSHEVAQGYKTIKEPAIYIKFKVKSKAAEWQNTSILSWTTTPWTLPANVALSVNPKMEYVRLPDYEKENHWLVLGFKNFKNLLKKGIFAGKYKESFLDNPQPWEGKDVDIFRGSEMIGLKYEPLFEFIKPDKPAYRVISADFVSPEEGTGVVHIAPAFGEEDMEAGKKNNLPILLTVDEEGRFKRGVEKWSGMFVKEADPLIIQDLKEKNLLFKEELYEHDYPFCWRCENPLLYYAKDSWFIKMSVVKKELLRNNQKINWIPEHLKEGRFGEWLKEVKDWNLSRERYWGTPLPIWQCQCDNIKVVGSIGELRKLSGKKIPELHRPYIDRITFKCEKCGKIMKRVPEVIDCWFDSGSMPYAQWHYPFQNKNRIDKNEFFPADFICEGIDQTRGWFYTLLAISTLLGLGAPYKNVVSHGIVLDAKGQKMSKSKGNVIWPKDVIDKFGADCARFYFYTVNSVGEAKRFDFKETESLFRRFFDTIWNSYLFFETYGGEKFKLKKKLHSKNLLDKWIISKLHNLNKKLIENLDKYYVVEAARLFIDFVDDLSNWYIRRSRRRFQRPQTKKEKEEASQTLYYLFITLIKLLAPFTPFLSEAIYQKIGEKESVHLEDYPRPDERLINQELEEKMKKVREIVTLVLAERTKLKIKVRQPLKELRIKNYKLRKDPELLELIKEEVNVKKITFGKSFKLDTKITPELKEEGIVREVIRQIQAMRKKLGLKPKERILVKYLGSSHLNRILNKNKNLILREIKAKDFCLREKTKKAFDIKGEIRVDQEKLFLSIKKI